MKIIVDSRCGDPFWYDSVIRILNKVHEPWSGDSNKPYSYIIYIYTYIYIHIYSYIFILLPIPTIHDMGLLSINIYLFVYCIYIYIHVHTCIHTEGCQLEVEINVMDRYV